MRDSSRTGRRVTRAILLTAVAVVCLAATRGGGGDDAQALTPGQSMRQEAQIWGEFFDGCIGEAPDNQYGCSCAATWMLGACRGDRAGTLSCLQRMQGQPSYAQEIQSHCGTYGRMSTVGVPGAVREFGRPQPHQIPAWNGGFNGCMQNATPEERRNSDAISYTCACVTTFLINACVAAPGSTRDGYGDCVNRHGANLQHAGEVCLSYGHLQVR